MGINNGVEGGGRTHDGVGSLFGGVVVTSHVNGLSLAALKFVDDNLTVSVEGFGHGDEGFVFSSESISPV